MSTTAGPGTRTEGCDHAWEEIGETTYTGDTWMHVARVLFCATCERYAARNTMLLDYKRRPRAAVERAVAEEAAARKALIAEHKARRTAVQS